MKNKWKKLSKKQLHKKKIARSNNLYLKLQREKEGK